MRDLFLIIFAIAVIVIVIDAAVKQHKVEAMKVAACIKSGSSEVECIERHK